MDKDNMNQDNMNEEPKMDGDNNKADKMMGKEPNANKGKFWTIFTVVIILLVAAWIWAPAPSEAPTTDMDEQATSTEADDSPEGIDEQLDGINVDDIEGEFQEIDQDLENMEN